MFKEKVESSVCQTELGHSEGELFPRGVIFPSNSCYEPYIISKELHSFGVQTNAHTHIGRLTQRHAHSVEHNFFLCVSLFSTH